MRPQHLLDHRAGRGGSQTDRHAALFQVVQDLQGAGLKLHPSALHDIRKVVPAGAVGLLQVELRQVRKSFRHDPPLVRIDDASRLHDGLAHGFLGQAVKLRGVQIARQIDRLGVGDHAVHIKDHIHPVFPPLLRSF